MTNIRDQVGLEARVSDQELLDRFVAERDEAAFAHLVERHRRAIWTVCRRILRQEHDAEDAFQAAFIVLSRKASSIRRGQAVGSWLYRVAYHIALRARKAAARRRDLEKCPSETVRENAPPSEAALRELQQILDEEVDRLAEKLRAPFVLCCLEGLSRPEAARELSWPEETVKARLAQARKLLQVRLVRRGITLSAALTAAALAQNAAWAAPPAVLAISSAQGGGASASALALAENFSIGTAGVKVKAALAALLVMILGIGGAAYHFASHEQANETPINAIAVKDPTTFLALPLPLMKLHDEQVLAIALSPDGKRLVTAGARQTLPGQFMVWDVEKQKEIVRLRGMRGIRGVAFAPDGKTVACGMFGGAIHLRDAETGEERLVLDAHRVGVNAVAFSADSDRLASAGLDKVVKLWDLKKPKDHKSFVGHTDMVFTVAMFRHGKALISGSKDRTAKIWDIASGEVKFNLTSPSAVEAVAVSPDDKTVVTASWDGMIKLWNAETGMEEAALPIGKLLLAVVFSQDGALLASSAQDGSMCIWDVKNRKKVKEIRGCASATWSIAFTPDSKVLVAGSSDGAARLWDIEGGTEVATLTTAEQKSVQALAIAPDGKSLAVAGHDKFAQVRDVKKGNVRIVVAGHADIVNCVAISADGTTLATGSNDKTIKLWDLATGQEKRTLTGHAGHVLAVAFAKDGRLASAGADKTVKWWNLADEKAPVTLQGHDDAVHSLAFTPDGRSLASGGADGVIRIWASGKPAAERVRAGHKGCVRALAFAPDGLLASAGDDGTVKVWEPGADTAKHVLKGHTGPVLALAFSPGGGTFVSGGSDKFAIVWDPSTGQLGTRLQGHKASVTAVAMDPHGEHLITGSDNAVLLRWRSDTATTAIKAGVVLPKAETPAKAAPNDDVQLSLKRRPENLPHMKLAGDKADSRVRFEEPGMRITIPTGLTRGQGHVALSTGMPLKGDFEITVNYEILQLPDMKDAGPESGLTLGLWRGKADMCMTGVTRRVVENGGDNQFSAWATWFEKLDEPSNHSEILAPAQAKSGRLRLVRTGGEVSYYASERLDGELTLLNQIAIGEADLDDLRLLAFTGGPRASLDARFWDLHIRMGIVRRNPAAPAAEANEVPPTKGGTRIWLVLVIALATSLAVLVGLTWILRRTQVNRADPPGAGAAEAEAFTSFSCSCGKALRVKSGLAGKELQCPHCGASVFVPGARNDVGK